MDNLLITGDGKHYKSKVGVGVFAIIIDILIAIVAFVVASSLKSSYSVSYNVREMMGVIGPIAGVLMIGAAIYQCYVLAMNIAASKTTISVWETAISGDGATNAFSVQNFKLVYSDIKNVDVIRNMAVVICTPYATYKCYAKNCNEIRDTILRIKG